MIAWKRLVATLSHFHQESQDFLRCRSPQSQQHRRNAVLNTDDDADDLVEDSEGDAGFYDHPVSHNIEWTDVNDLNLDAAHVNAFINSSYSSETLDSQNDVFHDCNSTLVNTRLVCAFIPSH